MRHSFEIYVVDFTTPVDAELQAKVEEIDARLRQQFGMTTEQTAVGVVAVGDLEGRLVVVGQSLGAFTAPLVAARIPAAELVLLAPMIPAPGESAGEWWSAVGHEEAIAPLIDRLGPMDSWGPAQVAAVFLHDVPTDIARESERFNTAPGPGMFSEPWPLTAWPDVPTRVLAPRDDRLFPLELQRRLARERLGLPVEVIPGGHVPMLARPRELAMHLSRDSRTITG